VFQQVQNCHWNFDPFKFPVERVDFFPLKRVNSPFKLAIGVGTLIGAMLIQCKYHLMNTFKGSLTSSEQFLPRIMFPKTDHVFWIGICQFRI